MRAYCIRKNAGSLLLIISFVLSASAYGQTAVTAGKDCPDAAVTSSDCGSFSRTDPASLPGKKDNPDSLVEPPANDHQTSSLRGEKTGRPTQSMNDTALSSNESEACPTPVICPPPSASVNKLDSDLPSPIPLKGTHRDVYSRPSTANNSFKSDQTKDERGRTVMGH
jgi:hypothetical protein